MADLAQSLPISLGGTLYGRDVNTLAQAGYAQQQQQLQDQAVAAQQAALQAGGQVQQAAGQGIPQDPALAQLLQTLVPGIADAITGGTGAQQRGEQRRQETRQERLQAREDNLTQLRDNYRMAAEQASKANDLKNEIAFRNKTNLVERQLDEMKEQIRFEHEMAIAKQKGLNVVRGGAKGGGPKEPKKATPAQKSLTVRWGRSGNYDGFIGQMQSYPDLADDPDIKKFIKELAQSDPQNYQKVKDALLGQ
jgi:hypothetical protein